jgi:hypothetical protein
MFDVDQFVETDCFERANPLISQRKCVFRKSLEVDKQRADEVAE